MKYLVPVILNNLIFGRRIGTAKPVLFNGITKAYLQFLDRVLVIEVIVTKKHILTCLQLNVYVYESNSKKQLSCYRATNDLKLILLT